MVRGVRKNFSRDEQAAQIAAMIELVLNRPASEDTAAALRDLFRAIARLLQNQHFSGPEWDRIRRRVNEALIGLFADQVRQGIPNPVGRSAISVKSHYNSQRKSLLQGARVKNNLKRSKSPSPSSDDEETVEDGQPKKRQKKSQKGKASCGDKEPKIKDEEQDGDDDNGPGGDNRALTPSPLYVLLFSFANVGDGCSLSASTDSEQLFSADYGFPSAHIGPVNASGIFKNTPSAYNVLIYCYNYDQGYDVTPTIDNVGLSVFNPSTGTNPIRPVATQVVANPGFDGGTFNPWTTSQTSGRADFSINNGRAQVQFTRIDSRYTTPAYIEQLLGHAAEASQHVTLTGDVYINIPNGGANCIATMGTNGDQMWIVQNIVSSQTYHVNLNYTTTQAGQYMELFTTCTGTQVCSTQFDNVMLTLNSF
nr:hypothetical protein B0A51_09856 [Rachicladosporium sp. CCFEE 5018]